MPSWGKINQANNAPKYIVSVSTGQTGVQQFGNTVFGYTPAAKTNANNNAGLCSPGWERIINGKGILTGVTVANGGSGYLGSESVTIGANTYSITVSGGAVTGVTIPAGSFGNTLYDVNSVPTVTFNTASGTGAVLKFVGSGRFGRKHGETLVAMRNIQ